MSETTATRICHLVTAHRTLVARHINHFNDIRIFIVAAHGKLYTLSENCTLFIYAATHCRRVSGDYCFRNIKDVVKKGIVPRKSCNFAENLIFQVLNLCIKFSHLYFSFLEIAYLYSFTHLLQTKRKLFYQVHFNIEVNRKVGVLVRRVYGSADKKVYIRCFFKEQAAYH